MEQFLNYIYVAVAVAFLFGAAVFFHELGHFIVARICGMKVEEFSIGFGPKILAWNRGGIEYAFRAVPFGGFVKLPQMVTSEALEGKSGAVDQIPPAPPAIKILVAIAGPAMNLVFAFVIASVLYFVGLPVRVNPPVIGYVEKGSAEESSGIRPGDLIVEVDGKPVDSWEEVQMNTVLAKTNIINVVIERDGKRFSYNLEAKVNKDLGFKILSLEPKDHPEVLQVLPDGAGMAAGLTNGDIIISFAGVPVASREQLIDLIKKNPGRPCEIKVERGGKQLQLTITPKAVEAEGGTIGKIGVMLGNRNTAVYKVQKPGPLPWVQVSKVWNRTIDTLSALIHTKKTGVGVSDLSGPVAIVTVLAAYVAVDYRLALDFMILLNVGLMVFNLIPLPVLDGGHVAMSIIEMIFRRPLNVKFVEYVNTAFAVLLISLMLYVTFNDFRRFPLFRLMFKQQSQIEPSAPVSEPDQPALNPAVSPQSK